MVEGNDIKKIQDTIRHGVLLSERGRRAVLHYRCRRAYRFVFLLSKNLMLSFFEIVSLLVFLVTISNTRMWHHIHHANITNKKAIFAAKSPKVCGSQPAPWNYSNPDEWYPLLQKF